MLQQLMAPPWAVCPAESFPDRFSELEQRLRATYSPQTGFRIRVCRKKDTWAVYGRKGIGSGFAILCTPLYERESFTPTRVSVWVREHSLATLLFRYLLIALVFLLPMLVPFTRFLAPRLISNPVLLAFSPLLFLLAFMGLVWLTSLAGWGAERLLNREPELNAVRVLVRTTLMTVNPIASTERPWTRLLPRAFGLLGLVLGLLILGTGVWHLWDWWSFGNDPLDAEMARLGVEPPQILESMRTADLVLGIIFLVTAPLILFGACALLRQAGMKNRPMARLSTRITQGKA